MLFPVSVAEPLLTLEQMELILCLLPVWLLDSYHLQACAWETDGGFIPQPHHTHRLLMIHLFFTIQSLCSIRWA